MATKGIINKGKNKNKSEILKNTINIPITISANKIKNIKIAKNLDATIPMSPLSKIPVLWIIALQKVYFLKIKIMNK